MKSRAFPHYRQLDAMDCGPSCLRMIAAFYGRKFSLERLRALCSIGRLGVSLLGIAEAAEKLGMRTLAANLPFAKLIDGAPLPCIVHWEQRHFVVVYRITRNKIYVADPAGDLDAYLHSDFRHHWAGGQSAGVVMFIEPTPGFFEWDEVSKPQKAGFSYLWRYVRPYKRYLVQLMLGLVVASLLQLILPFLTQAIVDFGINYRDLNFIYLILTAQLMIFISRTSVEFIRRWILLHLGTRINISIISE